MPYFSNQRRWWKAKSKNYLKKEGKKIEFIIFFFRRSFFLDDTTEDFQLSGRHLTQIVDLIQNMDVSHS